MRKALRFPKLAFGFLYAMIALAGILITPNVASARDRPGTPNNEKAYVCGDPLKDLPRVCVEFDNTASERVTFDIEFTVDGTKIEAGRPKAECLDSMRREIRDQIPNYVESKKSGWISRNSYNCEAAYSFNGYRSGNVITSDPNGYGGDTNEYTTGRTGKDTTPDGWGVLQQGFRVLNLDYDSTYCFRFKARRTSDDVVSEEWSNWACAKTAAPPPPPSVPRNVSVEYTPGGVDWRTKPPKVVVKWEPGDYAAEFDVQKATSRRSPLYGSDFHSVKTLPVHNPCLTPYGKLCSENFKGELNRLEFEEQLTEDEVTKDTAVTSAGPWPDIHYRVCAINIARTTCSQSGSTLSSAPPVTKKLVEDAIVKERPSISREGTPPVNRNAEPALREQSPIFQGE